MVPIAKAIKCIKMIHCRVYDLGSTQRRNGHNIFDHCSKRSGNRVYGSRHFCRLLIFAVPVERLKATCFSLLVAASEITMMRTSDLVRTRYNTLSATRYNSAISSAQKDVLCRAHIILTVFEVSRLNEILSLYTHLISPSSSMAATDCRQWR